MPSHVNDVNMIPMKAPATAPARARYHHGDLRNALLETALRLVAERGAEGFSLREAARELGVSPGAAYRHFADKQALMLALALDGHARLAAGMEKAITRLSTRPGTRAHAAAAFSAIGETYVEFAVRHPSHFRVMFGPCLEDTWQSPEQAAPVRDAYQILTDVLDELVATGVIGAQARAGAEIVAWSGVHGLAGLLVEGAIPLPPRGRADAVRLMARTLLVGLGADPALAPTPSSVVDANPRPPSRAGRR